MVNLWPQWLSGPELFFLIMAVLVIVVLLWGVYVADSISGRHGL